MRRAGGVAVMAVLVAIAGLPVRAAVTVTDDAGQVLTLAGPAQRIVSLAPHATELLFAAGAGDRVVGGSAFSDYPEMARALPQISGGVRLDIEQVLALRPDLAVGSALVVAGRFDDAVPLASVEAFAARRPQRELVVFDAGHQLTEVLDPMWERIREFLARFGVGR